VQCLWFKFALSRPRCCTVLWRRRVNPAGPALFYSTRAVYSTPLGSFSYTAQTEPCQLSTRWIVCEVPASYPGLRGANISHFSVVLHREPAPVLLGNVPQTKGVSDSVAWVALTHATSVHKGPDVACHQYLAAAALTTGLPLSTRLLTSERCRVRGGHGCACPGLC
jgi:hypothetical protein